MSDVDVLLRSWKGHSPAAGSGYTVRSGMKATAPFQPRKQRRRYIGKGSMPQNALQFKPLLGAIGPLAL